MTKSELASAIASKQDRLSETDVGTAITHLLASIEKSLTAGDKVEIRGFGSFRLRDLGARHARNPVTGETWRTKPTKAIHFKPGKELGERINTLSLKNMPVTKMIPLSAAHVTEESVSA